MTRYPLPYAGERWLFKNHPRAWGYHKALSYETDPDRREQLLAMVPETDLKAIRAAYTAAGPKTRRFGYV